MTTRSNTLPRLEELDSILSKLTSLSPRQIIEPDHHNKVKEFLETWMRYNCLHILEPELYDVVRNIKEVKYKQLIFPEDWNQILTVMRQISPILDEYSDILGINEDDDKMQAKNAYITLLNKLQEALPNTLIRSSQFNYRTECLRALRKLIIERPTWWINIERINLSRRQIMKMTYDGDISLVVEKSTYYYQGLGTVISTPVLYFTASTVDPGIYSYGSNRRFGKDLDYISPTLWWEVSPEKSIASVEWWGGYVPAWPNVFVVPIYGMFVRFDWYGEVTYMFKFSTGVVHFDLLTITRYDEDRLANFCFSRYGGRYDDRLFIFRTNDRGEIVDVDEQGRKCGWYIKFPFKINRDVVTCCARALDPDHIIVALTDRDGRPIVMCTRSNGEPVWAYRATNLTGCYTHSVCVVEPGVALVVWGSLIKNERELPIAEYSYLVYVTRYGVASALRTDWRINHVRKTSDGDLMLLGRYPTYIPVDNYAVKIKQRGGLIKCSTGGAVRWAFSLDLVEAPQLTSVASFYDVAEDGGYYVFSTCNDALVFPLPYFYTISLLMKVPKGLLPELYQYPDENYEPLEIKFPDTKYVFYLVPRTPTFTGFPISWEPIDLIFSMYPGPIYRGYYSIRLLPWVENYSNEYPPPPYMEEITYSNPITIDFTRMLAFPKEGVYPGYHTLGMFGRIIEDEKGKSSTLFINADLDTSLLYALKISGPSSIIPKDATTLTTGDIVILCEIANFGSSEKAILVIVLDKDGNYKKAFALSFGRRQTIPTGMTKADDNLLIYGYTNAMKDFLWRSFIVTLDPYQDYSPNGSLEGSSQTIAECFPSTIDASIYGCAYGMMAQYPHTAEKIFTFIRETPSAMYPGYLCIKTPVPEVFARIHRHPYPLEPEMWATDIISGGYRVIFTPTANYNSTIIHMINPCVHRTYSYRVAHHIQATLPLTLRAIQFIEPNYYGIMGHVKTPSESIKPTIVFVRISGTTISHEKSWYFDIPGREITYTSAQRPYNMTYYFGYDRKTGAGIITYIRDIHLPVRKGSFNPLTVSISSYSPDFRTLSATEQVSKMIITDVPSK